MTTVLVAGAEGFAGRGICEAFAGRGMTVRAIAGQRIGAAIRQRFERAGVAICDGSTAHEAELVLAARGCDAVVHAPTTDAFHGTRAQHNDTTLIPIENTLAAAQSAGCRRFVLISSELVTAGNFDRGYVDERLPHAPRFVSAFAEMMALAESLVLPASGRLGCETTILRAAMSWGPDDVESLALWIRRARSGAIALPQGGRTLMATTFIDNLVDAAARALDAAAAPAREYYVTDDERTTGSAFIKRLLGAIGVTVRTRASLLALDLALVWLREPTGGSDVRLTFGELCRFGRVNHFNVKSAREDLGYDPMHLDAGLARVREWAERVGGAEAIVREASESAP